jgi:hypothetical protein
MINSSLKGDVGVLMVFSVLSEAKLIVLKPICESVPFDLVIYHNKIFYRIQVKRAQKYKNTKRWTIPFRKTNPNATGYTEYFYDKTHTDIVCGVIPETGDMYFFPIDIKRPKYEIAIDPDDTITKSSYNKVLNPEQYRNILCLGDSKFIFPRREPIAIYVCIECGTKTKVRAIISPDGSYFPDSFPLGWEKIDENHQFSTRITNYKCPSCFGRKTR